MQLESGAKPRSGSYKVLRALAIASAADLLVVLLLVLIHVVAPNPLLIGPIDVLGAILPFVTAAALGALLYHFWSAFPKRHRSLLFITGLTAIILLAHVFIVGLPAATGSGAVIGNAGSSFNDGKVSVNSSLSGTTLSLTVSATGGSPIANITVAGASPSGQGFNPTPTLTNPLLPGSSVTGSWNVASPQSSLTVSYQYVNCYASNPFRYGCIMDEVFYVPEAQGILNGQQCSTTTSDCHMEHPWLSPAIIAAGMAYLGEFNSAGWRIMPALLGTFSIPILFAVAWKLSGDERVAAFSALLLAVDVMFFSQSSAALLDVPMVFFGLSAALVFVTGARFWKFDEYIISGGLLGLAGLTKETAVFMAAGLLGFNLIFGKGARKARVYSTLKMLLMIGWVFALGLQAYDSTLATPAVPTFVNHIQYILSYGSSLKAEVLACQPTTGYWCKFPSQPGGPPILPTDWLLYYTPVAYYATSVSVCPDSVNGVCQSGAYSYVALAYYGVTNLLETWTTYIWLPLSVYLLYKWRKSPQQPTLESFDQAMPAPATPELPSDLRFAAFATVWFVGTYVPYLFLFILQRVTYPFYFLPAVPAIAMGAAFFITRSWFSKWLVPIYLGMAVVFFFVFFPDKSFLPDWLRVIIGH
ncbi:MAG TPA: glycosyltransferase family 39 protein [Nitrososphaerales archaeon]|nr:glycosyltransferase family 39 protein [Nitrososphaerales archaeon]